MATFPGIHMDVVLSTYPLEIQKVILRLAQYFYITRSFRPTVIGNSQYYAVLARPTDEFSVYVNAERELIVLFSNYQTFEIRTLEAFDEFYEILESARVDKSIRFLVSNDQNIESQIRNYLAQNPEYPIIIPLTFSSFSRTDINPLLAATRHNYLLRDLFGYQSPLREDTFFFGRQSLVNSIIDLAKSGQSSSIFGLRKSGKTSAIYAVSRKSKAFGCSAVVVDCQSPAIHARKYGELLTHIADEVRKAVGVGRKITSLGNDLAGISETFRTTMLSLLGAAKTNIILIFDEIENISPNTASSKHWRDSDDPIYFWQNIRSLTQSAIGRKLSICLVGTNPSLLELSKINGIDNPMYLFTSKQYMPNLSFDETRSMVESLGHYMGMKFSPELIAKLQSEYGGHPFFIRQVCSQIHQAMTGSRPATVSNAMLAKAQAAFASQLVSYMTDIIRGLNDNYPAEVELLRSFLAGRETELLEFSTDAPELVDHLIGYGIVEKLGDGINIKLHSIKIALHDVTELKSAKDRWSDVSKRRNAIESSIRRAILYWSKMIDSGIWHSVVTNNLTKTRIDKLSNIEPGNLLSNKRSPLYLSDLLSMIKDDRCLPYLKERRGAVVRSLDVVNRHRIDAHAKTMSDIEFKEASEAFEILEREFLEDQ